MCAPVSYKTASRGYAKDVPVARVGCFVTQIHIAKLSNHGPPSLQLQFFAALVICTTNYQLLQLLNQFRMV